MRPEPQRLIDRREFPILYVDDERENLRAFELTFRREYEVHTAESGREALEIINNHPIAVVLSDHRMPEMTGTEFLNRVRTLDPRTVRLLVTAYGDAETLADAVNNGSIYRYIPKPWNLDEMRQVLSQAVDLYALESEREALLSELTTLRSISHDLAAELDLGRLANLVVRTVVDGLSFDGATLLLASARGGCLRGLASVPSGEAATDILCQLEIKAEKGGTLLDSLRAGDTVLLTPDHVGGGDPVVRKLLIEVAADEILCIPLLSKGHLVGGLIVDNRRGGRRFLAAERALLEGLAAQVAIAVDNARVVSGLRRLPGDEGREAEMATAAGLGLLVGNGFESFDLLRRAAQVLKGNASPQTGAVRVSKIADAVNDGLGLCKSAQKVVVRGDAHAMCECEEASMVAAVALLVSWCRLHIKFQSPPVLSASGASRLWLEIAGAGDTEALLESAECRAAAQIAKRLSGELQLATETDRVRIALRCGISAIKSSSA